MAAVAVASWYTFGVVDSWAAGLINTSIYNGAIAAGGLSEDGLAAVAAAQTSTGIIAGAVGGVAAGAVGGGLSAGLAGGNAAQIGQGALSGAEFGAVGGAFAGYFGIHPQLNGIGSILSVGAQGIYGNAVNNFAKREFGVSGFELDAFLEATSFLGNEVVGDRVHLGGTYYDEDGNPENVDWESGILSRNTSSALIQNLVLNRIVGVPFDAADIALGFQGIPTATDWEIASNPALSSTISEFHSLGALGGKTLFNLGEISSGNLDSLPIGNFAPNGMNLELGINDPVNMSYLGNLLNWGAQMIQVPPQFGPFGHANYPGLPP